MRSNLSSQLSYTELNSRLTSAPDGAMKETPPTTPRGTTSSGSLSFDASTAPTTAQVSARSSELVQSSAPSPPTPGPSVGPPKGKLTIKLCEARNLRVACLPYVVCTFESNEFISKGPTLEDAAGGMPVPGSGRGIAIPMRGSSTPTIGRELRTEGTTDPTWGQEAVL